MVSDKMCPLVGPVISGAKSFYKMRSHLGTRGRMNENMMKVTNTEVLAISAGPQSA